MMTSTLTYNCCPGRSHTTGHECVKGPLEPGRHVVQIRTLLRKGQRPRLLTWSLLRTCPWESGVCDKAEEDESGGRERGVRVAADLVWTVVSSAVGCWVPAAKLGDRLGQTGEVNSSQMAQRPPTQKV